MQNQLIVVEKLKPAEVYNSGNIDTILEKIAADVRSVKTDISTKKGREEVASLAYKVAQSKTFLDKMGKTLGDDARKQLETLNAERKKCVDFLDKLKDEVRNPLTEWETKEKNRLAEHENEIANIFNRGVYVELSWQSLGTDKLKEKLSETECIERDWQEFESRAKETIATTLSKIKTAIYKSEKHEAEQAELAKFREQERIRLQKEHDDRIAAEAAAKAKADAEAKAKEEIAAKEREAFRLKQEYEARELAIKKEKEDAERKAKEAEERIIREKQLSDQRAKEAAEKAEREKQLAIENERKRIEKIKSDEIEAERKREANKKHVAKIHNAILDKMILLGLTEEQGKAVITAIAKSEIENVRINY